MAARSAPGPDATRCGRMRPATIGCDDRDPRPRPDAPATMHALHPPRGPVRRAATALTGLAALLAGAASAQSPAPAATTGTTPPAAATAGTTTTTSSGLVFQLTKAGQGASPKPTDVVRVHYRGTFLDGKEFDSSHKRGQPAEFPLNRVIPCWTEGLQLMQVGASARLTCPPAIAYGARGAGNVIPPNTTLKFEVELLGIAGGK